LASVPSLSDRKIKIPDPQYCMDLLGHPYLMIIERGHVPLCADDYGKDADPEAEGGERDDLPPGQSCTCAALSKTPPKKLQLKGTVSRDGFGF
jgi:hypothetical protein